jgi:hypothetical protein
MSIDVLLDKRYDSDNYHCVHFVIDAGKHLFNYDFSPNFLGLDKALTHNGAPSRHTVAHSQRADTPSDGTVVLITKLDNGLHVGLYLDGRVLHLTEQGVRFETVRALGRMYKRIRYYNATDFPQSA